ncbi:MAG: M28 family peptidase [Myxococcales bacterium]|nr:M28 family peptidase [Myxococcales bacterium]MCB9715384.1 M28 family peptidase [Myxococcales bacterium]
MRPTHALVSLLLLLACHVSVGTEQPADATPAPPPSDAGGKPASVVLQAEEAEIREHLEFLADDAQMGRPPGTEADRRVQAYVVEQMKAAGLQPAFGSEYTQPFDVVDGVRMTAKPLLRAGEVDIPHAIVPFSTATTEPVAARLIFVGHGIAPEGKGTGDYKGLGAKVKGNIVVALGGAPKGDPHLSPSLTRPQSKVIAARDHGAVGFILWEPSQELPYPNHGEVTDSKLPVLWVGKEGTSELLGALGVKARLGEGAVQAERIKPGKRGAKPVQIHTPIEPVVLQTANVSGILPGPEGAPALVIGAHMDHLGMGTSHSLAPGVEAVHNGADDNASGVAVILEMARVLGALPPAERPYTLCFVAFGAEEMGLLGSKHYVEHLPEAERERMVAMLNFDMVGRLDPDKGLVISGVGTSSAWPGLIERFRGALTVSASDDGYGASDQTSFYEDGLPVLHFFTGPHSDYHKPSDDADKINFAGADEIAEIAIGIVHAISTEGTAIDYIKVARAAPTRGGFKVSLGTIPDYGAQVDGVRLSGVREGGAAAKAGLLKADVVKKIGDREIHNLDDFMATFGELEPGQAVEVVVERDGQSLTISLVPDAPQRR